MAYFRCTGGGSGATLTLTFSSEFYGQTITATNGTKTVTKVAPSTGTMEITLPESGTWVISCTISGSTYSTSVEVDIDYTATLEAIPDGSTVTPTDDIQTWLKCAGITDKTTYTTLADVLADTDTFIALCADSNACDYMARSTTWAGSTNGKVPTMTDNTHPSGIASASSVEAENAAYKAFDNNSSTYFAPSPSSSTTDYSDWIQYEFENPTAINHVEFSAGYDAYTHTLKYKIQGLSSSNATPVDLYSGSFYYNASITNVSIDFVNDTKYKCYRLVVDSMYVGGSYYCGLYSLQFYYKGVQGDATAMQIVGKYGYCANALRNDNTWNTAINNSPYASYVPVSPVVPTGTVIHSAVEDTTYYIEGGQSVPFCTIASGDTETVLASTIESLKNQTITLYSSVAKDPTNLSNDYSKQIRITPNVTEIYLMPNTALYWWGSEYMLEDCITTNGWSLSGYTLQSATHNKNNLALSRTSNTMSAVASKIKVRASAYNAIAKVGSNGLQLMATLMPSKNFADSAIAYASVTSTSAEKVTVTANEGDYYPVALPAYGNNSGTVYAMWYE